ncbi:MAG: tetratricopeptide repeat protein [Pedobacter sp.]|nr:MAG: tetratricopeptide repeat protein [Pedobacter sp.]
MPILEMLHQRIALLLIFFSTQTFAQSKVNDGAWSESYDSGYYYLNRFKPGPSMKYFSKAIYLSRELPQWYRAASLFGAGQATWYAGNFHGAADTVEMAIKAYPANNKDEIILALRVLSNIYDELGSFEKAFTTIQTALSMNKSTAEYNTVLPLVQMGKLYKNIGDFESAMHYYQQALAINPTPAEYPFRELYHSLGGLYVARQQFDSAAFFYRKSLIGNPLSKLIRLRLGELHILQSRYDSAYLYLEPLYTEARESEDINVIAGTSIGLAKVMRYRADLPAASRLATEAFNLASERGVYRFYQEAAELLALINEEMGDTKSALYFHKLSDSLQQASASDVYKGQLFAFRQKWDAAAHAADLRAFLSGFVCGLVW